MSPLPTSPQALRRRSLSSHPWTVSLPEAGDGLPADAATAVPPDVAGALAAGIPARVPGCVHDDLLAAGLIPDPYTGAHEADVAWVGRRTWRYETDLPDVGPAERLELVLDGVDTVADLSVGGPGAPDVHLGSTRNMHRRYRFDLTDPTSPPAPDGGSPLPQEAADLRAADGQSPSPAGPQAADGVAPAAEAAPPLQGVTGPSAAGRRLRLDFTSPYAWTEQVAEVTGLMPGAYEEPYALIRKMAANFGWDWGPTVVTAGLWREARLEAWSTARLAEVRASTDLVGDLGRLRVVVQVDRTDAGRQVPLEVRLAIGGTERRLDLPAGLDAQEIHLDLPAVRPWWPHTLGESTLYDLNLTLHAATGGARPGPVLDTWTRRVGFRRVDLVRRADAGGTSFGFTVNGRPTFARGFNWIPDDTLISRMTPERYRDRLAEVRAAGADWVRVWGGGVYEDDAFYDICDEMGLLVWQDFAFACSAYPETPDFAAEVEAEARDNVARLMHHASLALWNGNNENFMGRDEWGWEQALAGRGWGAAYYLEMLPRICAELDPDRPYWPGSPYSGEGLAANDPDHGCHHSWEVWNQIDYVHYRDTRPRFVAEFGWQAPAAWTTLADAVGEAEMRPDSPVLGAHQKAIGGMDKLARGLRDHFGPGPWDPDTWWYLTQLVQARAIACGVGYWRSLWPHCAGAIVWQINDCWPVISWAALDSAGRRKPMWYAARRAFADRVVVLRPAEEDPASDDGAQPAGSAPAPAGVLARPRVHLVNQGTEPWTTRVELARTDVAGTVLARAETPVCVAPSSVLAVDVPEDLAVPEDPSREFLLVTVPAPGPDRRAAGGALGPGTPGTGEGDGDRLREVWLWTADADFADPEPDYEVDVRPVPGGAVVGVRARTLMRETCLQADRLGAGGEAEAVTLLPGERHEWHLTRQVDPDASWAPPVLTCLGHVRAARRP